MTETKIGVGKTGIARLDRFDPNLSCPIRDVSGKNLLGHRHGARLGVNHWQRNFLLHARDVEVEKSAVLDDLSRNLIFPMSEFGQRNLFAPADLVNQLEIRRGQYAEILAVLLVNALDILG